MFITHTFCSSFYVPSNFETFLSKIDKHFFGHWFVDKHFSMVISYTPGYFYNKLLIWYKMAFFSVVVRCSVSLEPEDAHIGRKRWNMCISLACLCDETYGGQCCMPLACHMWLMRCVLNHRLFGCFCGRSACISFCWCCGMRCMWFGCNHFLG